MIKLKELKCIENNVNIKEYLKLYKYVRDNMEHSEWLGEFSEEEIIDILKGKGKIWLYYTDNTPVCSMFYIPVKQKTLDKYNLSCGENETGALGPIMVSPDFIGNGLQHQMMEVFHNYCKSINKKYIFTKAHTENVYSTNNMLKCGYVLVDKCMTETGEKSIFIKEI